MKRYILYNFLTYLLRLNVDGCVGGRTFFIHINPSSWWDKIWAFFLLCTSDHFTVLQVDWKTKPDRAYRCNKTSIFNWT